MPPFLGCSRAIVEVSTRFLGTIVAFCKLIDSSANIQNPGVSFETLMLFYLLSCTTSFSGLENDEKPKLLWDNRANLEHLTNLWNSHAEHLFVLHETLHKMEMTCNRPCRTSGKWAFSAPRIRSLQRWQRARQEV